MTAEREHQGDEQQPTRRCQRGEAGHPLAEVVPADAAPWLPVQAEGPQRREPVGRKQGEDQHSDRRVALEWTLQLPEQRNAVERRDDPDREHRRREQRHRICGHGRDDAQLGRPARPRAGPGPRYGGDARRSLFEGPPANAS